MGAAPPRETKLVVAIVTAIVTANGIDKDNDYDHDYRFADHDNDVKDQG